MQIILMFIVFLVLIGIGVPIVFSMLGASVLYIFLQDALSKVFIAQRMISSLNSFILLAIPFYITAGCLMNEMGVSKKIFSFAEALVGHMRGGLAHVNIIASLIFAGMSGSGAADVSGLGKIEIKAMVDAKYPKAFSAAITAASATIGPIVPPSINLVIFGVMTETSIGALFLSGFFPGIFMAIIFMIVVVLYMIKKDFPIGDPFSLKQAINNFISGFFAIMSPIVLLTFLIRGIVTPSELGIIMVFYTLLVGLIYREISLKKILSALEDSAILTSQVMFLIAAASIFGTILVRENIPRMISDLLNVLTLSQGSFLLLLSLAVLFLGCFMEGIAILVLMVPMATPIAQELGVDMVHLGLVMVLGVMIGSITPPFGFGVYIASDIAKVDVTKVFKESIKFIIPLIIILIFIIIFPGFVLYLPRLFLVGF